MPEQMKEKKPLNFNERLIEKGIKTVEKHVADQTTARLQQGQDPVQILQNLVGSIGGNAGGSNPDITTIVDQLSKTPTPIEGSRIGVLGTLTELIKGQGLKSPLTPRTQPMGAEGAVDMLNKLISTQKGMQDLQAQTPEGRAGAIETKQQEAAATARGGALGKQQIAADELQQGLNAYFEVADYLPTGDGLERFTVGMQNILESVEQKSPAGLATARIEALNKWLRVKLVRRAGDVGNLNVVEQLAAEQMLFNKFDSTQMRGLKKTLLTAISNGINNNDPQQVKDSIAQWMKSPGYEEVTPTFKSEKEVEKANLPKGTKIIINGREAIWE